MNRAIEVEGISIPHELARGMLYCLAQEILAASQALASDPLGEFSGAYAQPWRSSEDRRAARLLTALTERAAIVAALDSDAAVPADLVSRCVDDAVEYWVPDGADEDHEVRAEIRRRLLAWWAVHEPTTSLELGACGAHEVTLTREEACAVSWYLEETSLPDAGDARSVNGARLLIRVLMLQTTLRDAVGWWPYGIPGDPMTLLDDGEAMPETFVVPAVGVASLAELLPEIVRRAAGEASTRTDARPEADHRRDLLQGLAVRLCRHVPTECFAPQPAMVVA
jgi:hypothetical protein